MGSNEAGKHSAVHDELFCNIMSCYILYEFL